MTPYPGSRCHSGAIFIAPVGCLAPSMVHSSALIAGISPAELDYAFLLAILDFFTVLAA